ncbi:hypothetical protein Daesc_009785 [Daldinia eschscholtzii]|uniref:Major facilitator superfamily (MFS) profile domain-containing protein n=1 Tax=Daldinia eschscholtzii TaxID=292717 RepID=A0AAX6MBZ0_9PEZI
MSDTTTSLLATGVVGIAMFVFTVPAVLYIDRVGRKPVLTIGAIAVIVAKNADQWASQAAAGWAAAAMVWLFVIHFGYSWGPCAWIIVAEIWPLSSRPYGTSLGASSNWMNNFSTSPPKPSVCHRVFYANPPLVVGQVTPIMLSQIGYGTYILFGLLTFLGAGFIWFFVPETKRLTLEEMVSIHKINFKSSSVTDSDMMNSSLQDVIFGSEGTAQADFERMDEINREIGLTAMLHGLVGTTSNVDVVHERKDKLEEN